MTIETDRGAPHVNPRPGIVKTLGVLNLVFSVLTLAYLFVSSMYMVVGVTAGRAPNGTVHAKVLVQPGPRTATKIEVNPFLGLNDRKIIGFGLVDSVTGVVLNGLMFATGVGLLNLRRWGARWWTALAWAKIARLILLGGFFIVAVVPVMADGMARMAFVAIGAQQGGMRRGPTIADLVQIYSIMFLILAALVMVLGSIYPALSIWMLSRPGVKAALIDKPSPEPDLP